MFWIAAALLFYVYLGYPAVLILLGFLVRQRPGRVSEETLPLVTVIVTAYNEADVIGATAWRILKSDYPADLLECIVVSDGSTDATARILASIHDRRLRVIEFAERRGKTACQNTAVPLARGEVLVFTDANTACQPTAIRVLARRFNDPDTGCVCGELHYESRTGAQRSSRETHYWPYELWLRRLEARLGAFAVFNGALYAVRKSDFVFLDEDVISDFIEPLEVYAGGRRMALEVDAVAIEVAPQTIRIEFERKRRIVLGGLSSLHRRAHLLNPFRHPLLAFELLSHKLLRWFTPVLLAVCLVTAALLSGSSFHVACLIAASLCAAVGIIGFTRLGRYPPFGVAACALLTIGACSVALVDLLRGRGVTSWNTVRYARGH